MAKGTSIGNSFFNLSRAKSGSAKSMSWHRIFNIPFQSNISARFHSFAPKASSDRSPKGENRMSEHFGVKEWNLAEMLL
jgi:hypothetical protein